MDLKATESQTYPKKKLSVAKFTLQFQVQKRNGKCDK